MSIPTNINLHVAYPSDMNVRIMALLGYVKKRKRQTKNKGTYKRL